MNKNKLIKLYLVVTSINLFLAWALSASTSSIFDWVIICFIVLGSVSALLNSVSYIDYFCWGTQDHAKEINNLKQAGVFDLPYVLVFILSFSPWPLYLVLASKGFVLLSTFAMLVNLILNFSVYKVRQFYKAHHD